MFKELVVTALLGFTSSYSAVKPLPVKNITGARQVFGNYCIRDSIIDYTTEDVYAVLYDYQSYANDLSAPKVLYYDVGALKYYDLTVRQFDITREDDYLYFHCNLGENSIYADFLNDDYLPEFSKELQDFIIYFPNPIILSESAYKCFSSMFTSRGNSYCTFYSGYYTYDIQRVNVQTNYWFYGSLMVNGGLYNHLNYSYNSLVPSDGVNCTADLYGNIQEFDTIIIDNGRLVGANYVLINDCLINNTFYNRMLSTGAFAYLYDRPNYEFGDLVFSVIDAPIYMLSQLFSFELFGIQFYVAFTSVATVLLILCVVRKFI